MIDFWLELKEILPSSPAIRPSQAGQRPAREPDAPSPTQRLAAQPDRVGDVRHGRW